MEMEDYTKTLSDELVEKIIAMVPFPAIFKARCLSKSWRARFSSIGSLDEYVEKRLATSFQNQVRDRSKNWGPFVSVCISNEKSSAFDWASQKYVTLPPVAFLPKMELDAMSNICLNGALLWTFDIKGRILCVANIFTQTWKALPPPPNLNDILFCNPVLVSDTSLETYKLVLFYEDGGLEDLELWSAVMYDSMSGAWSNNMLVEQVPLFGSPVYLNGVLYMIASYDLPSLLTLNLKEGTSEELKLGLHKAIEAETVYMVVCNAKLVITVRDVGFPDTLRLLQIDLESLQLVELTRVSAPLDHAGLCHPVGFGDYIVVRIYRADEDSSALMYNVHKNEWSPFDLSFLRPKSNASFSGTPFYLGLNPFLAV